MATAVNAPTLVSVEIFMPQSFCKGLYHHFYNNLPEPVYQERQIINKV